MREFPTGATRDTDEGKPDFAGYLSPRVLARYGQYMLQHQTQADGKKRASGNWKKGIPRSVYLSSLARHFLRVWLLQDQPQPDQFEFEDALCALIFNSMGMLHELQEGR